MRRRSTVATAALIAAFALAGLAGPTGSHSISAIPDLQPASFTSVTVPATSPALRAWGVSGDAPDPNAAWPAGQAYVEPGTPPSAPVSRPKVSQPGTTGGSAWKAPKSVVSGFASFYNSGTTAMRLPRGTVIRVCGAGGCIERTVTDYGPRAGTGRVIDMYRPDFFRVCGCASWSGTTKVTISVY